MTKHRNTAFNHQDTSNEHIPIEVQPPNQPTRARFLSATAPYNATHGELAYLIHAEGYPSDILDARVIRSRNRGDRWSVVLWTFLP